MSAWISVKDSLPGDGVEVEVKNKTAETVGWKYVDARMHEDCPTPWQTAIGILCDITHWRPLV